MIPLTSNQLLRLAPRATTDGLACFAKADDILRIHGINENPRRLRHFMAQVLHETGGLTTFVENMHYSAKRLMAVWPGRFPTIQAAMPYANNPEKLANKVYGGRMGNHAPGDGWRYIGRGLLHLTGREGYERIGGKVGIPLARQPELAFDPQWALPIACAFWTGCNGNSLADRDDLVRITKVVSGGSTNFKDRHDWLVKTLPVWPDLPIAA